MLTEAKGFKDESDALAQALLSVHVKAFSEKTQFKNWTIDNILAHLHVWNHAALLTLESREQFTSFLADVSRLLLMGKSRAEIERVWLDDNRNGIRGLALMDDWCEFYPILADKFCNVDTNKRVAWGGPDMSVSACIVARQMETWAHGQAIFDKLGMEREETDRVKNIAHLGVTTYSWTFRNRGLTVPLPKPYIRLIAPSGTIWEWNEPQQDNRVEGSATEFAQVVTQTRNIGDTSIVTTGPIAAQWMGFAQCFAGEPETPPAIGTRFKV